MGGLLLLYPQYEWYGHRCSSIQGAEKMRSSRAPWDATATPWGKSRSSTCRRGSCVVCVRWSFITRKGSMFGIFTYKTGWFLGPMLVNIAYMEHLGNEQKPWETYWKRKTYGQQSAYKIKGDCLSGHMRRTKAARSKKMQFLRRFLMMWSSRNGTNQDAPGWWLSHPFETYESQLGWWNSQFMEK